MPKNLSRNVVPPFIQGPSGPLGGIGDSGDSGDYGSSGPTGSIGPGGSSGLRGDRGPTGPTLLINNDANDRVLTSQGDDTVNAEHNLRFDGTILTVDGELSVNTLDIGGVNITASADEINLLDPDPHANISIPIDATDKFIINDAGEMKQVAMSSVSNFIATTTLESLTVDNVAIDGTTIGHTGDTDLITLAADTVTVAGAMNATTVGGALSTAAQTNITSLGTLTALTVDNVAINGTTIGHTGDTDLLTLASGTLTVAGEVSATTLAGALTGNVTGTADVATVATTVTITDNENENESNALIFTAGGDVDGGNLGLESDGTLTYNPSTGKVTATGFVGAVTGNVTGNASGTSATVTTAAQGNITSVGTLTALTMGGELSCVDNLVTRPVLKDYAETVNVIGTITGDTAVSFAAGNVQTVTGNGNCLFTFTNPPASGKAGTVTLIITNGGANTTTWHSSVKWPGDNAPALTSSGVDVISLMTIDAGTTVYGFVGGINFG